MSPPGFDPAVDETIASSLQAPGLARRALDSMAAHVTPGVLRDAQLLISEVVTNSVRHSGSDDPIRLRVWARSNGVKVEIADGGVGFEARSGGAREADEGGRGLMIVDAIADRWGVSHDARARVWFELSPRSARGAQTG